MESHLLTATEVYGERGYPWALWDEMRLDAPVFWHDVEDCAPFWAITRHAEILEISRRPEIFVNSQRLRIFSKVEDELVDVGLKMRAEGLGWNPEEPLDMVFMDDPRHRQMRLLTSAKFTPGSLGRWRDRVEVLAEEFAADLEATFARNETEGVATDLVGAFSAKLPQAIICEMMGLPSEDWPDLLHWTNALVGAADPAFLEPGEDANGAAARAIELMRDYFMPRIEAHRSGESGPPGLVADLLAGEVDGRPLTEQQLQGYFALLVAAGSETTRNGFTGGVLALLENREQIELLCSEPEYLPSAVEEILRWTSPVIQFARTAVEDFELAGVRIRAGEDVGMFYPSANRDEAVFDEPYRFDVTRSPNHHLAFGHGAHFCLGANLARREIQAMLAAVLPQMSQWEVAAPPQRVAHLHVGGIKALPLRHRST